MKHIFTASNLAQGTWLESVAENTKVLLQGQPFSDQVKVFVPLGTLNKSEALAEQLGTTVHGRRWGTITRNDGHYIEITVEDHEGENDARATENNS